MHLLISQLLPFGLCTRYVIFLHQTMIVMTIYVWLILKLSFHTLLIKPCVIIVNILKNTTI